MGHTDTFWISDQIDGSPNAYTIQASIALISEHAYWYVDDSDELSIEGLRTAARVFEESIHPLVTGATGDIWNPGVDNDPRLTVLHTPLRGAAGYFGSRDEYTRETHPKSNEREMIYMDSGRLKPGSDPYLSVLTHEFQHAVNWNLDAGEDAWVNEGLAELATQFAGYRHSFVGDFLEKPGTQLNFWPEQRENTRPHYGASELFMDYLASHYGGYERLGELSREPADGVRGVDAYLSGYGVRFEDVFRDWVVANYLDAPDGRYGYPERSVRARVVQTMTDYGEREGTLAQFSARYIDLRMSDGDAIIGFEGDTTARQTGTVCRSGQFCWWSNRGDSIDSRLTREFDLRGLSNATLEFWAWFDIEEGWDYAYVEVSGDGGETWGILKGRHTTTENPVGNSYGDAWTGESDGWVREKVDLTPYVGGKALVRFEYVTDDAVYLDGLVIDDLSISETGFFDGAERENGWRAEGFTRIDNTLPQEYSVQVIEVGLGGSTAVRQLELDTDRKGELLVEGLGSRLERAVVVISPMARDTRHPAAYRITVDQPR